MYWEKFSVCSVLRVYQRTLGDILPSVSDISGRKSVNTVGNSFVRTLLTRLPAVHGDTIGSLKPVFSLQSTDFNDIVT